MKRALATAVLLLAALTACGGGAEKAQPAVGGADSRATAKQSKPSGAAEKRAPETCKAAGDVIVWSKVPGLPDSSQRLGGFDAATCEPTFDSLPNTSPTQAGYCTLAAWASDNPGYDTDSTPAKRPKAVQVSVGPDC